jgi:putative transposase
MTRSKHLILNSSSQQPVLSTGLKPVLERRSTPEDITDERSLLKQLTKAILERSLQGKMTTISGIHRTLECKTKPVTPATAKSVQREFGKLTLEILKDRDGSFGPVLIGKHERRFLLVK